ncbi:MAG TPA: spore germination protein GerW family protein [Anaeromyxobacteraceae bacterium]|nr:spore germination protein GerW family protein [Anaeromyxobacteraceae bacterium]
MVQVVEVVVFETADPALRGEMTITLTRGVTLPVARPGAHPVLRFTRKGAIVKDMESLFGKAIGEIERILDAKTVVGDPITVEGNTLIPIVSVGFGFGIGAGEGTDPKKGAGSGGGTGGGGGVKPVAVIIVSKDGVRVESLKSTAASLVEKVADVAAKFVPGKSAQG